MILKRRVALGGIQLDSLDSRILITGINEAAGKDMISAVSLGGADGQRITNRRRDTLDITVKFAMKIRNDDMAARSTLLDTVNAWARPGGWLTVGHRSGKWVHVVLAQAPGGGDQYDWGNDYTIVFRAYEVPFWEDVTATTADMTQDDSGTGEIVMPGSADTAADVTITNKSGSSLSSVSVTIGSRTISFSNLNLANDASLVIDHVHADGIYAMRARIGETSVLSKKSGADEFVLSPGSNAISWTAGGDVAITVSGKGRYL